MTSNRVTRRVSLGSAAVALMIAAGCVARPAGLLDPSPALLSSAAPDSFAVEVTTTAGAFAVTAHRDWAPRGVDRFYYLATHHYYDQNRFFRVIKGFVAQFGLSGDPRVAKAWEQRKIDDDQPRASNTRGRISFASDGPKSRTTQLFINLRDNPRLDTLGHVGFAPIAEVTSGMDVVDKLYDGYGEGPPRGKGPDQDTISAQGTPYLLRDFPRLDCIIGMRIVNAWR